MPESSGFFPLSQRRQLWETIRPGNYHYKILPDALIGSVLIGHVLRLSGLRQITERCGRQLNTSNFSSLSHALGRWCYLVYAQALICWMQWRRRPRRDDLEAIDGMAVTLPATQRHRCRKYNSRTVGGGVIWSLCLAARRGECAVRVLKVTEGAWHDGKRMKGVALVADGPVCLMDRGFFVLERVRDWLRGRVRFIVRVRHDAVYQVLKALSPPRRYGTGRIELDARVRLGSERANAHPVARMVRATVGKQTLVLVTSEMRWSAERVLQSYKKRDRIEKFHQVLKDVIGLAHLYSFAQNGLAFLLHVALLLAMLLVMEEPRKEQAEDTVTVLRRAIKTLRRRLGLSDPWKRNTYVNQRKKSRQKC